MHTEMMVIIDFSKDNFQKMDLVFSSKFYAERK